jgi:hypothetical protein
MWRHVLGCSYGFSSAHQRMLGAPGSGHYCAALDVARLIEPAPPGT